MEPIIIDTREKQRAIVKIVKEFDRRGIPHISSKLFVGDYQLIGSGKRVIDRKQNLSELCLNVCQGHKRFRSELERAQQYGIKLIVLCEHGCGIERLEDVIKWENPRLKVSPMAMSGERLYRVLAAVSAKYGVDFEFCNKNETASRIIELLEAPDDGNR